MANNILEENSFYKYLETEHSRQLLSWKEPRWRVCIPSEELLKDCIFNRQFAESHALQETSNTGEFISLGCGKARIYHQVEDALLCHQDKQLTTCGYFYQNQGMDATPNNSSQVIVTKVSVISEHFITIQNTLIHLLLISEILDPTPSEEAILLPHLPQPHIINSIQMAENFLREFSCHCPVLEDLQSCLHRWQLESGPTQPLYELQCSLHNLLLGAWDDLIHRHSSQLQVNTQFQDLLYIALDFIIIGWCHSIVWWRVRERCGTMDDMVTRRLRHLRTACFTPHQMDLPPLASIPAPAAVVELAALGNVDSAIGRLYCFHDALEHLQAHAKQAQAELHTYTGADCSGETVSEEEMLGLLVMTIIEAQCPHLVSNLYYTSHYVFSLPDNHSVRCSSSLVKSALQKIMQLDINKINETPCKPPLRKEVSLHDLMKITSAVEQTFERPRWSGGASGGTPSASTGHSTPDISSHDLYMQELTQRIQKSTMESSSIDLSPTLSAYSPRLANCNSPYSPFLSPGRDMSKSTSSGLMNGFMEFISTIPSSIRSSLRRKQTEQRQAVEEDITEPSSSKSNNTTC